MVVAALETTAVCASAAACIFENGELKAYAHKIIKNGLTHSETLLPALNDVLTCIGKTAKDVELYSVCVGPGSFTGVRIGVSLVKGLAFTDNIPCAAVSPIECAAYSHSYFPGKVCTVMDARRKQFYYGVFENGKQIVPDSVGAFEDICEILGDSPALICGDGAKVFCSYSNKQTHIKAPETSCEQNALAAAVCGFEKYKAGLTVDCAKLLPVYLRKPQAEREREERLKKENENKN